MVKVIIVTFFRGRSDRRCPYASNNDVNFVETRAVHFA